MPDERAASRIESAQCPRCGYDQSGAIAAWERDEPARCPLAGVCSECGLDFLWRDLLNPVYTEQGRVFDCAESRLAASFALTWWRSLRPWAFWSWAQMENRVVAGRRFSFVLSAATINAVVMLTGLALLNAYLRVYQSSLTFSRWTWSDDFWFRRLTDAPLSILADPETGLAAPAPWVIVCILAVILSPLSYLLLPATLHRTRVRHRHIARIWSYGLAWLPVVLIGPAVLVHLAAFATFADAHYSGPGYSLGGLGYWLGHHQFVSGFAAALLWLPVWWSTASGRYLRLPHGFVIGISVTFLSLLISVGLIAIVPGGLHWMVRGL